MAMMAGAMSGNSRIERNDHPLLIPNRVKPPIPKGCKVWHEYGGVIALNEKSAKRKFKKQQKED